MYDKRLKIIETTFENTDANKSYGEVVDTDRKNNSISISTGKGILKLHKVQPEGKAIIDSVSFINGYGIKTGIKLKSLE